MSTVPDEDAIDEDDTALAERLRAAVDGLPRPRHVLFTAPAPDADAARRREERAEAVGRAAGLLPWPDWAVVRNGAGNGPHLFGVIVDLVDTGRAAAVVVCGLDPLDPALVGHAESLATDGGLEFAYVGAVA